MTTEEDDGLVILDKDTSAEGQALWRAGHDTLEGRTASAEAGALVQHVFEQVQILDTRQRIGAERVQKLRRATEAFLSALLLAQASESGNPFVAIATRKEKFTGREISYSDFMRVRSAFEQKSWVKTKIGFGATFLGGKGAYTRFSATESLLELSRQFSVEPAVASRHFKPGLPHDPLVLKAKRPSGDPEAGRVIRISDYLKPAADVLREDVRALNAFLDKQELSNCVHNGYVRTFNCGDMPEFNWNMGGRLYSQGAGNYQQQSEGERLKILINGERVCELDFRASYLTFFYALHGEQLPLTADPYLAAGLQGGEREAAKKWVVASVGKGKPLSQWSNKMCEAAANDGLDLSRFPASRIETALLASYPLLSKIENDPDPKPLWARLMFTESQVIVETMKALMAEGIPSLSMHDGLIVSQKMQGRAEQQLKAAYKQFTRREIAIKISTDQTS